VRARQHQSWSSAYPIPVILIRVYRRWSIGPRSSSRCASYVVADRRRSWQPTGSPDCAARRSAQNLQREHRGQSASACDQTVTF